MRIHETTFPLFLLCADPPRLRGVATASYDESVVNVHSVVQNAGASSVRMAKFAPFRDLDTPLSGGGGISAPLRGAGIVDHVLYATSWHQSNTAYLVCRTGGSRRLLAPRRSCRSSDNVNIHGGEFLHGKLPRPERKIGVEYSRCREKTCRDKWFDVCVPQNTKNRHLGTSLDTHNQEVA